MRRQELEHVLRSASVIAGDLELLIVGSQSILGTYDETELPDAAYASIEVDVTFFDDPDNVKSDTVDMHIGEDSTFHVELGTTPKALTWLPRCYRRAGVTEQCRTPAQGPMEPPDIVWTHTILSCPSWWHTARRTSSSQTRC